MKDKVFFHIDVNSAYLSWEAAYRKRHNIEGLDLINIASAVAGSSERRSGIILAKSQLAKKLGVKTGEPVCMARTKCPDIYLVPPNFDLYVEYSNRLMDFLKTYSPSVYQYSIDEAFVDMTGTQRLFGNPIDCADTIRERVRTELGFTINVGVSDKMVLAKIAGDFSKPDKTHTLFQSEIEEKMWPLPIEDLFFVGRKTSKKLRSLGIITIGQLANTDINFMKRHFKKHGIVIHNHANGLDGYDFFHKTNTNNRSVGNSTTTSSDIYSFEEAKHWILALSETVCARLRRKNSTAGVVSVELVDRDFKRSQAQRTLGFRTNKVSDIYGVACEIFKSLWWGKPIRHIGIGTSKVQEKDSNQLNFFNQISSKEERLYSAMDDIRAKYGDDSVKRASFLCGEADHMEGGTSKNKKNGLVYL